MQYDVIIIGGGVVGSSVAYQLSRYDLNISILEAENDIAVGTTKANSAIVHAGYDPEPDTLMAKLNIEGNRMCAEICKKLDVPFKRIGSLVLAFNEEQVKILQELYERGIKNGVPNIKILSPEEILSMEPNINKDVKSALYAPTAAIVSPWEMTLAMAEVAVINGVKLYRSTPAIAIDTFDGGYKITTTNGEFTTRYIFNAAGIFADKVHAMLEEPQWKTIPSKGEYYLMDKVLGNIVSHVIFQCPGPDGKGVLIAPTVHSNLIVGPSASLATDTTDLGNSSEGLNFVREKALLSVPSLTWKYNIRNFSGLRANTTRTDFIMEESKEFPGFFDLGGIKSPGLTSAPAIGLWALDMLKVKGVELKEKPNFKDTRTHIVFNHLSSKEKDNIVKKKPSYGKVICRCETVTEGEIVEALHSPIVPYTINGIKRRCGAGMGRCQSGFCGPRVQAIISRELKIPLEDVLLEEDGSYLLTEETKKGLQGE